MRNLFSKLLTLIAFLIGIASYATAQGTSVNLILTLTNGEEQTLQLSDQSHLHFDNGENLVIDDGNGTTLTFALANIRKIVCAELTDLQESAASQLQILPNPSYDHFIICNLSGPGTARIYAIDGRMMKSFEATEGLSVDISELPSGMYLLHLDGQTLKLMKL
jgi:hypothetical protein